LDQVKFEKMFGIYVREKRCAQGLSVEDLARNTKISSRNLLKIESGQTRIREVTRERLASVLCLDEQHLDRLRMVARVSFVESFMNLVWEQEDGVGQDLRGNNAEGP